MNLGGMFTPILIFLHFFVFELQAHMGQTDRKMEGQDAQ